MSDMSLQLLAALQARPVYAATAHGRAWSAIWSTETSLRGPQTSCFRGDIMHLIISFLLLGLALRLAASRDARLFAWAIGSAVSACLLAILGWLARGGV